MGGEVFDALRWPKNEFESTTEYGARLAREIDSLMGGPASFRVVVSPRRLSLRYDADTQRFTVLTNPVTRGTRFYAQNFGGRKDRYLFEVYKILIDSFAFYASSYDDSVVSKDFRVYGITYGDGSESNFQAEPTIDVPISMARRVARSIRQALVFATPSPVCILGHREAMPRRDWLYYIEENVVGIEAQPLAYVYYDDETGEVIALRMLPRIR